MRLTLLAALFLGSFAAPAEVRFRAQEIAKDLGVVYAVSIADINGDRKPDVLALSPTQVLWFENPTWQKHVALDGVSKKDNVTFAAHDIDGDKKADIALGADWQATNTASGGSLQWIGRQSSDALPWTLTPIAEEPTLHRIRWGDVTGDGKADLVVVPLHGRGTKAPNWDGQGARILVYQVPRNPRTDPWPVEAADESLHIVHNFIIQDGEIWAASKEGVHALRRGADKKWTRRKLASGAPGEIKLGRVNGTRHLATIEPWHGTSVVVLQEGAKGEEWTRTAVDETLTSGHALGWGDFDGDKSDELAAGWRNKPFGVALYKRATDGKWTKAMVDADGMAAEDLAVQDLNGDGRPEIIAGGRSTQNVKIYWNQGAAK